MFLVDCVGILIWCIMLFVLGVVDICRWFLVLWCILMVLVMLSVLILIGIVSGFSVMVCFGIKRVVSVISKRIVLKMNLLEEIGMSINMG